MNLLYSRYCMKYYQFVRLLKLLNPQKFPLGGKGFYRRDMGRLVLRGVSIKNKCDHRST